MSAPRPLAERLVPQSFPHPVQQLQLRETASAWVVLTGTVAYKIKKPVHFDFLDAATLERRHWLCDEELRLNRRFAPQLYLQVVAIQPGEAYPIVADGQRTIEYAVAMRQFQASQELSEQLARDAVGTAQMQGFGQRLAAWHGLAEASVPEDYGSLSRVRAQLLDNLATLERCLEAPLRPPCRQLRDWTCGQLDSLGPLLQQRRQSGRVRECHGDLHAGNIVQWQGQWLPFDCLEFDPALRWIDVMSEVAFLWMDLASRGHPGLAFAFLDGYLEPSGDFGGLPLLPLFAVYRALVRAKVDCLAGARQRARERLSSAERLARAHRPALILMHGLSGSGKSWLSERLLSALPAVRVRSDIERRRLLGPAAHSAEADTLTYQRLLDCASAALSAGLSVIVDAAFLQPARLEAFRQRRELEGVSRLIIDCQAPVQLLEARLGQRAREATDPSEADLAVLKAQRAQYAPLPPMAGWQLLHIDTSHPQAPVRALEAIRAVLR